ncbi:MAG: DUF3810 domain-containing protein [Clostridiales bacterium]|nr:DUF3810 domain-containing protein [Clostridiales bacterium]
MNYLRKLKRIYLLLLLPLSLILILLARQSRNFAEFYALHIYKWLSQFVSLLSGIIPLSIIEFIILILPIFLITLLVRFVVSIVRDKDNRKEHLFKGLINVICTISLLFFAFTLMAGLNYYRYSFTHYSNLEVRESSLEELYNMTKELAHQASDLRSMVSEVDENGVFKLSMSNFKLAKETNKAMRKLSEEYQVLSGRYGSPKPIILSPLMSYTEITGVFIPFTMEANVNVHISDYSIPATMLHELAHQRGFMREDEANFIAYLAGINSDNIEIMYSSTMLALIISGNALYRQDRDLYFEIRDIYSDGVVKDIRANTEYWARYEDTVVSAVSSKINDTYLKANAQSDGVRSYGRMVDLLLAKYRADKIEQE